MVYYNPKVFTPPTRAILRDEHEIPPTDPFYKILKQHAQKSREEAISRDVSGHVTFMVVDKLYEAGSVGTFEFKPLLQEPSFIPGINWGSAFFLSLQSARVWIRKYKLVQYNILHHTEHGTVEVHYHY